MPTIYVGIDVSKYKFDACIKNENDDVIMKPKVYAQNLDGIQRLIHDMDHARKEGSTKVLIGMESSGRYHVNLMGYLLNLGYDVREFNPIEVHGYRISKIRKSKNDSIDTRIIAGALILNRKENTQRYIKDQDYVRMREIGLLHHRLVDKTSKLKVEMREALTILCPGYDALFTNVLGKSSKEILRRSVKHTKLFEISQEEIEDILRENYMSKQVIEDKARKVIESFVKSTVPDNYKESLIVQIRFILDQHDLLKRQMVMLESRIKRAVRDIDPMSLSIDCVGPITCAVVIGAYGDMNRFTGKKAVTAYAGLDPRIIQSGKSINRTGRISKTGNKYVRRYLLNAAFVGCKCNPVIKEMYTRLRGKGKPHLVALTACARKLLLIMYSVEKNQKPFYIPKYVSEQ